MNDYERAYAPEKDDNKTIIRVANALDLGVSLDDIHTMLLGEGMSEREAYLAYQAGRLLHEHRKDKEA